jgi:hypothetical protein
MTENEFLRKVLCDCSAALGNGSACSTEASLEFMATVPAEIAAEVAALRAELQAKGAKKPPVCRTVGQLIEALKEFPRDTPVGVYSHEDGVLAALYNEGRPEVFVGIEQDDGAWEEDFGV